MKRTMPAKPQSTEFCIFETALGRCALAWSGSSFIRMMLPGKTVGATRQSLKTATNGVEIDEASVPSWVQSGIDAVRRHALTGREDLAKLPVDLASVPPFHRLVYEAAMAVPSGSTSTYGQIAAATGSPQAARAVGQALGRNPLALIVPCHRITAANGKPGGFSAWGGLETKARILAIEQSAANGAASFSEIVQKGVTHLRKSDAVMAGLIDTVGDCALKPTGGDSVFAALAKAIVYQQLSGKAAATIFGRFRDLFPGRAFPKPDAVLAVSDEILRGAGLSRAKALAIRDLAEKVRTRQVPDMKALKDLADQEIIAAFVTVRGVGRWTAEMLLIFDLGRPDVLPVTDYGIRKGFAKAYGKRQLPEPEALAKIGERWKPYRSIAAWYLWRTLDSVD